MMIRRNPAFLGTLGAIVPAVTFSGGDLFLPQVMQQQCEATLSEETIEVGSDPVVLEYEFSQAFPPVSDVTSTTDSGLEFTLIDEDEPVIEVGTENAQPGEWVITFHAPGGDVSETLTCTAELTVVGMASRDDSEVDGPVSPPAPPADPEPTPEPMPEPEPTPAPMPEPEPMPEPMPEPEPEMVPEGSPEPTP